VEPETGKFQEIVSFKTPAFSFTNNTLKIQFRDFSVN